MKKIHFVLAFVALFIAACSGNKSDQQQEEGTHTHEDGSVHKNHEEDTVKQEEFTAPGDSASENKEHTHDGHDHPHTH